MGFEPTQSRDRSPPLSPLSYEGTETQEGVAPSAAGLQPAFALCVRVSGAGHGNRTRLDLIGNEEPHQSAWPAWSERRDSNAHTEGGSLGPYHWTTLAWSQRQESNLLRRAYRARTPPIGSRWRVVELRGVAPRCACLQGTALTCQTTPWSRGESNPCLLLAKQLSSRLDDDPEGGATGTRTRISALRPQRTPIVRPPQRAWRESNSLQVDLETTA